MDKASSQSKSKKTRTSKKATKATNKGNAFVPPRSDMDVQMTIVETNGKREIVFVAAPNKRPGLLDNGCAHEMGELNSPSQFMLPGESEKHNNSIIDQNNVTTLMNAVPTDRDYISSISATGRRVQKIDETYSEIISINASDGVIESVTPVNLMKDVNTSTGIVDVATIVAMGQGSKDSVSNISSLNQVQVSTSQTIVSDVGFTNLLHKHLYSTTMTGTGPPLSETVLPEMEHTTTVAAADHTLAVADKVGIIEPAAESRIEDSNMSLNVQDLAKLGVPFTSTGFRPGEALPQIIFVPVLTGTVPGAEGAAAAGPASASPVQQVNYMPVLAGQIAGAEPGMVVSPPLPLTNVMPPLNYGVMGAIPVPLQTSAQNMENVLYVQPNTAVVNNTVERVVEMQPVVTASMPKVDTMVKTIPGTLPGPPIVRKPQRRRQSRQKSVSSDASSVDSSETTSLMKQNIVTKKIERVRRTVNTEDELNSKVSSLVSKIMSQFPKEEQQQPQQPTKPARQSPRPAKRSKSSESNNNVTGMKLPHVLQSPISGSSGSVVGGPAGMNILQVGQTQGLNQNHAQLVQNKLPVFAARPNSSSSGSGIPTTTLSQQPGVSSVYANQMQSNAALLNALQGKRLPKVPPKPLVSRIELPTHFPSPAASASAAHSNVVSMPMVISQEMLLRMNQSSLENSTVLVSSNSGVQVQNKTSALVRDFGGAGTVIQHPEMLITDPGLMSAAAALTTLIPANMMVTGISDTATATPNATLLLPQTDTFGPLEASMILSSLKSPGASGFMPTSTGVVLPAPGSSVLTSLIPPTFPMTLPTPLMTSSQPAVQYTQIPLTAVAEAVSSDESDYETEEEMLSNQ